MLIIHGCKKFGSLKNHRYRTMVFSIFRTFGRPDRSSTDVLHKDDVASSTVPRQTIVPLFSTKKEGRVARAARMAGARRATLLHRPRPADPKDKGSDPKGHCLQLRSRVARLLLPTAMQESGAQVNRVSSSRPATYSPERTRSCGVLSRSEGTPRAYYFASVLCGSLLLTADHYIEIST